MRLKAQSWCRRDRRFSTYVSTLKQQHRKVLVVVPGQELRKRKKRSSLEGESSSFLDRAGWSWDGSGLGQGRRHTEGCIGYREDGLVCHVQRENSNAGRFFGKKWDRKQLHGSCMSTPPWRVPGRKTWAVDVLILQCPAVLACA